MINKNIVSEKWLEKKFKDEVKKLGGKAYKFSSPMNSGVYDRLTLFPGKIIAFVEIKTTGKKLSPLQELFRKEVLEMGFPAFLIDSKESLDEVIELFKLKIENQ